MHSKYTTMNNYDYIIWHINESEDELRAQLEHPEYYAEKVKNLKPGGKRLMEVLAVRCALKVLFNGEEQQVHYDEFGAPALSCGNYISISHTSGYAAVCVSPHPVGIDIERIGQRVQRVVSKFLKNEELVVLQMETNQQDLAASSSYQGDMLTLALHLAWSAKEAIYKVLGHDYYDLKELVSLLHIDWQNKVLWLRVEGKERPWRVKFDYNADYVFCLVMA